MAEYIIRIDGSDDEAEARIIDEIDAYRALLLPPNQERFENWD